MCRHHLQAGLYDRWKDNIMDESRRKSRIRQRKRQQEEDGDGQESNKKNKALTIVHMQGPLVLHLLGLLLAGLSFIAEMLTTHPTHSTLNTRSLNISDTTDQTISKH